jgi:Tol biopolymer transport system component
MRRVGLALFVGAALVSGASGAPDARPPVFKGEGTIVFACAGCPQSPTRGELYTVSASGRGFRRLPTTTATPFSARWSPDGRSVAFHTAASILRMRVRPKRAPVRMTRSCDLCDRDPAWAPGGRSIVFVREGLLYTIRVASGAKPRALQMRRRHALESPDWAPDGRHIAFHDPTGLYVMRRDSRGAWRAGRPLGRGRLPRWSPDGTRSAYIGQVGTGHAVMVIRPDGTGQRVVAFPQTLAMDVNLAWSPDGRHLLFLVAAEFEIGQAGLEFWVVSLATRSVRRIAIPQLPPNDFADIHGVDWR